MSSPTKTAEDAFQFAMNTLQNVKTNTTDEVNLNVRSALSNMAYGLKHLSVGLRATYILLEDVQKELRQLQSDTPTVRCDAVAACARLGGSRRSFWRGAITCSAASSTRSICAPAREGPQHRAPEERCPVRLAAGRGAPSRTRGPAKSLKCRGAMGSDPIGIRIHRDDGARKPNLERGPPFAATLWQSDRAGHSAVPRHCPARPPSSRPLIARYLACSRSPKRARNIFSRISRSILSDRQTGSVT